MHGKFLPPILAAVVFGFAVIAGASANDNFIRKPTQPLDCRSLAGASGVWQGYFSGKKEADWGFQRYETTTQQWCFRDERSCQNWLYNMKSEYNRLGWSATCNRIGK